MAVKLWEAVIPIPTRMKSVGKTKIVVLLPVVTEVPAEGEVVQAIAVLVHAAVGNIVNLRL